MGPDLRLLYQQKIYTISIMGGFNYHHATQRERTIADVNAIDFSYGLNGRLQLTKWASVNTDLKMRSKRGYNVPSLNRDELI